jgi:crotonobetainyl-CoA:carnitine CoA-transferase CaiB-like acyl-CoA transferase
MSGASHGSSAHDPARAARGPLSGTTVVEFSDYVTGPYAAVLLADMGARVVKLEAPGRGDPFRGWGAGGYSPTFCSVNRGKESITVDLRKPAGQEVARALAQRSDVFIENHRPGVAERFGVGYERLHELNPRLVYCSISGFGQDGPYRDRPGYDTVGQALGGLLSLLTDWEQPKGMGISLSDHLAGVFAAYGILGALVARERSGIGQRVETSLLQATVAFVGENAARYFDNGEVPDRRHRTHTAQVYAFVAGDGLPFVIHLSSPQKFFTALCETVGRPELVEDPRFCDRDAREHHYEECEAILAPIFRREPRSVWLERLRAHDVPAAPLNSLEEVFADPQVRHLGMEVSVRHPERGEVRLVNSAVRLSATPTSVEQPPPVLGEHTDALLREIGYDAAAIDRLRSDGVV